MALDKIVPDALLRRGHATVQGAGSNVIRGTGGAIVLVMYDEIKKVLAVV